MAVDLTKMVAPATCAVLTMEVQRGVVGDLSTFPQLADAAQSVGLVANASRLLEAARTLGITVIHCTAEFRSDRVGSVINCQLISAMLRNPEHMLVGSPAAELLPEFGPDPRDIVLPRLHGVSPFAGTALDPVLRSLGVKTVVAIGVSVNLGVLGLAIEAVNYGYQVVVPRDAVAGVNPEYADSVLDNTFPLISTVTTTDKVLLAWQPSTST
jgi:nicotinamidase-related amidase